MDLKHGFEATIERPGGYDQHGVKLAPTTHTIERCARDQATTAATVDGVLVVTAAERLICDDPSADVQNGDVILLPDGSRWQVDGEVDRPVNPFTGWAPGCIIPITRSTGAKAG